MLSLFILYSADARHQGYYLEFRHFEDICKGLYDNGASFKLVGFAIYNYVEQLIFERHQLEGTFARKWA